MKKKSKLLSYLLPYAIVIIAYIICQLMMNKVFGLSMSRSLKGQLVPVCCWIVMAISLNLVVGVSGELSLGHAGFMSIGAFTGVVASTWLNNIGVTALLPRMILTFIIAGAFSCVFGFLIGIPVLRLRGDYLAIVTLAFGEIIRNVLQLIYVNIDGTKLYYAFGSTHTDLPGTGIINGAAATKLLTAVKDTEGNIVTPAVKLPTEDGFLVGFILILFTLFIVLNLIRSRSGRAIMAVRDNSIAAESNGIDIMKYRLMAFVVSATLAGMAGALYGLNMTVDVNKFSYNQSINVLVFVVLGGIGNITGSIISSALLTILPEKLRFLQDYRMLIYAIVLIVVMLVTNSKSLRGLGEFFSGKIRTLIHGKSNSNEQDQSGKEVSE